MALPFPEIDPIAFSIGPLVVRWYALAYLVGFLGGWKYALALSAKEPKQPPSKDHIDDFLPWAILGVILGGRIGYVLFYQLPFYLDNPLNALKIWEGGMAFHGGALGVIIALFVFAFLKKIPLLRLTDVVCATVPIGVFFGRVANFINGELWGRVTEVSWGVVFPYAGDAPRHPSQLYEAFLEGLVLFFILFALYQWRVTRNMPGIVTGAFLAGYGIFRMIVENFREPDAHLGFIWGSISMGQILSLPMFVLGISVILYAVLHKYKCAHTNG
ncbi:MAG: prolipoprotein diacylglyceryl transferase [Pseudomonadota bacterium]